MGLGMPIRVNRNTTMINLGDDGDRDDDDNVSTMYQRVSHAIMLERQMRELRKHPSATRRPQGLARHSTAPPPAAVTPVCTRDGSEKYGSGISTPVSGGQRPNPLQSDSSPSPPAAGAAAAADLGGGEKKLSLVTENLDV